MLTSKDYTTLALSVIALCLSLYNFYRSRKDTRAANIRTIARKRFERLAMASEVWGIHMRSKAALEAVRFDAQLAHDADLVKMLDEQIFKTSGLLDSSSQREQDDPPEEFVTGSLEELFAAETLVGLMESVKARAVECELTIMSLVAESRRKLALAASFVASP